MDIFLAIPQKNRQVNAEIGQKMNNSNNRIWRICK